jgi:hypothetical protein
VVPEVDTRSPEATPYAGDEKLRPARAKKSSLVMAYIQLFRDILSTYNCSFSVYELLSK